jgi:hypothetical protein
MFGDSPLPAARGEVGLRSNPGEGGAFHFVIAGPDPAIHAESRFIMDHRVKPGGDEGK